MTDSQFVKGVALDLVELTDADMDYDGIAIVVFRERSPLTHPNGRRMIRLTKTDWASLGHPQSIKITIQPNI